MVIPIGTPELKAEYGERIKVDEAQLLESLPKLASLQAAWLFLYFCAVPRINHRLRTVPPIFIQNIAHSHDTVIYNTFSKLFGISAEYE